MSQPVTLAQAPRDPVRLSDWAVTLNPGDDVAVAKRAIAPGTVLVSEAGPIRARRLVPSGHKIALRQVPRDAPVHKYGEVIGKATEPIEPGDHVHVHNLVAHEFDREYAIGRDYAPVQLLPVTARRSFLGFRRRDGRVGTRNFVAVLPSVNCASSAAAAVARHFETTGALDPYPNVDGVIAFTHAGGCGAHVGSDSLRQLQRTLTGSVDHPNVAAYVVLSLGCEDNQPVDMIEHGRLGDDDPLVITIQDEGGFASTVERGIAAVESLLPRAEGVTREAVPVSEITLGLQCGGSDGWSGVTANPALGLAADRLVREGGTVVLGETTEIYGAEHLLTRRACSVDVGERLVDAVRWWERHVAMWGASIDNNPSPGNKAGGLTTIYEKSLGAAAKAGSTPLNQVVAYAERVTERGFVHMDTPGYDPVSVTGQVAGGCNLIAFTTGRGSAFGFKPAPSIKIASNSELYARQAADMDIDAGKVLAGASLDELGEEIFDELIAVASGKRTKSELAGIGTEEFNPWLLGVTL